MTTISHRTERADQNARHGYVKFQDRAADKFRMPATDESTMGQNMLDEARNMGKPRFTRQDFKTGPKPVLSAYQKQIMSLLDTPKTSVELSAVVGKSTANVGSALANMRTRGLVTARKRGHLNEWSKVEGAQ